METFALFDFDGTICKGDSIVSFLKYSLKHKQMTLKDLAKGLWGYTLYVFKRISSTQAKERGMAFLKGKTQKEVEAFCQKWYDEKLSKKIFEKAKEEIKTHQKNHIKVLVVTASPDLYLNPFKEDYGIIDIIGTRIDVDEKGICTGRISGENVRGLEKNLRIAEYLAAKGWTVDTEKSWGYGNSIYDEPMLHLVGNPVLINPSKKLKKAFPKGKVEKWKA